jgi:hypothetical protein
VVDLLVTINDELRRELLSMKEADLRWREELLAAGELGGPYHPQMEAVQRKESGAVAKTAGGWQAQDVAGIDGAEAGWWIAQHAVGEPDFMRRALDLVRDCAEDVRLREAWRSRIARRARASVGSGFNLLGIRVDSTLGKFKTDVPLAGHAETLLCWGKENPTLGRFQ